MNTALQQLNDYYMYRLNKIWKIIKTITFKNRQTISIPNSFKNADETPTGKHDIADVCLYHTCLLYDPSAKSIISMFTLQEHRGRSFLSHG